MAFTPHNRRVSDLIDTTEMYLRTIFELEEDGIIPLRARIAERLNQSGPTVSQTVARMERDGLLTVEGDRHLQLTEAGRAHAEQVMRRHRLAECLLLDVLKVPLLDLHHEACRWEHVMTEQVEERISTLLNNPQRSPFGNAIPGISSFDRGVSIKEIAENLAVGANYVGRVARFSEAVQESGELVVKLFELNVRPGHDITVARKGDAIIVNGEIEITDEQAAAMWLEA